MQIFILSLVILIFSYESQSEQALSVVNSGWWVWALFGIPKLLLVVGYAVICKGAFRWLGKPGGAVYLRWVDRAMIGYRWAVLVSYAVDLWVIGVLTMIRRVTGDVVLLDELVLVLIPLTMIFWAWWVYYPIDRRLREAVLMRRIDTGLPVAPIWPRGQYLIAQIRHQFLLMLIPMMLLLGWLEVVDHYGPTSWVVHGLDFRVVVTAAGCVVVLLVTPALIRHLWDTIPLPEGELRSRLTGLCRIYRVRVREVLLWRTYHGLVNAAVMGVLAPFRYILLSDALLEGLKRDQVEAVMAHEVAHIRCHHVFWMLILTVTSMGVIALIGTAALEWVAHLMPPSNNVQPGGSGSSLGLNGFNNDYLAAMLIVIITLVGWMIVFGWVSRRMERQADTFAVVHLSKRQAPAHHDAPSPGMIDMGSVQVMVEALEQVAQLNHIDPRRRSWRHGSIAWRQAYLKSLVQQSTKSLPIDQQIFGLKLAGAVTACLLMCLYWMGG